MYIKQREETAMYIVVNTIGMENVKMGDPIVVKYDSEMGRIGAFGIDGNVYGYLRDAQPYGCVDGWTMYSRIGDKRIIARAYSVEDGSMVLAFENPIFGVGNYRVGSGAQRYAHA